MVRFAKPLERKTVTAGCFLKVKRLLDVVTVGDRRPGRLAKTREPLAVSTRNTSLRDEVVPVGTLRREDLERGGGKGANLGELISMGLPVPPGFCVTTAAYRRAVAEAGLVEAIDDALRSVRAEDPGSAEAVSARIGLLFEDLPLPDDLAEAILVAYRTLGAP